MCNTPEQKLRGVVKAEHVVIILNVVLIQKGVELLQLKNAGHKKSMVSIDNVAGGSGVKNNSLGLLN